jgi:hypothetical protein
MTGGMQWLQELPAIHRLSNKVLRQSYSGDLKTTAQSWLRESWDMLPQGQGSR